MQYLEERCALSPLPDRKRVLFENNCPGHRNCDEVSKALSKVNSDFPSNDTDEVHPADKFLIEKISDA